MRSVSTMGSVSTVRTVTTMSSVSSVSIVSSMSTHVISVVTGERMAAIIFASGLSRLSRLSRLRHGRLSRFSRRFVSMMTSRMIAVVASWHCRHMVMHGRNSRNLVVIILRRSRYEVTMVMILIRVRLVTHHL